MDYEICPSRHRLLRARAYAPSDLDEKRSLHNQITEAEGFERWFYEDSCFEGVKIDLEEIPPAWRDVL
jgi:hypothetical protein